MKIPIKSVHINAIAPARKTDGAAGYDLHAAKAYIIPPGDTELVLTGISMAIPSGFWGEIKERSGLALYDVRVGAGVID